MTKKGKTHYSSSDALNREISRLNEINERQSKQIKNLQREIFKWQNIVNTLPNCIYTKNLKSHYTWVNEASLRQLKLVHRIQEDIIGKNDLEIFPGEAAKTYIENDQEVISQKKGNVNEEIIELSDGHKLTQLSFKEPLVNEKNELIGILGYTIDITERKNLQKKLIESEAREARFKAMSALSAMMAHELRTPLAAVKAALESWQERLQTIYKGYQIYAKEHNDQTFSKPQLLAMKRTLSDAEEAVCDAMHTINSVLADIHYATGEAHISLETFPLQRAIETAIASYPFDNEERSLITLKRADNLQVKGDTQVIIHVLHNLIKNALHAIAEVGKGNITITTEQQAGRVSILFQDSAKGIPAKNISRIFEPFFTTKEESAASIGIGLYFCRLALEKIGGSITCESKENEYTRFIITLPSLETKN